MKGNLGEEKRWNLGFEKDHCFFCAILEEIKGNKDG
jgi:hypothetical protein